MRKTVALALIGSSLIAATGAAAQVRDPLRPLNDPAYTADRHRLEMDRLRARSQANATELRLNSLETRLTVRDLEARRQPPVVAAPEPRLLRSPEAEGEARRGATIRRETVQSGVGQIDSWLDRGLDRGASSSPE